MVPASGDGNGTTVTRASRADVTHNVPSRGRPAMRRAGRLPARETSVTGKASSVSQPGRCGITTTGCSAPLRERSILAMPRVTGLGRPLGDRWRLRWRRCRSAGVSYWSRTRAPHRWWILRWDRIAPPPASVAGKEPAPFHAFRTRAASCACARWLLSRSTRWCGGCPSRGKSRSCGRRSRLRCSPRP